MKVTAKVNWIDILNELNEKLPKSYLNFMDKNPDGRSDFRNTAIWSKNELHEKVDMIGVGEAYKYECLKLNIKFQIEIGYADIETPNYSDEEFKIIKSGFVFGDTGEFLDDFLYFDLEDNSTVWFYSQENGWVKKIAESFDQFNAEHTHNNE